jgi:hypothetical protein
MLTLDLLKGECYTRVMVTFGGVILRLSNRIFYRLACWKPIEIDLSIAGLTAAE